MSREARRSSAWIGNGLVDGHKTVVRMDEAGILYTVRAVVPIRAIQTLMTDTPNVPITTITDGVMNDVAARVQS